MTTDRPNILWISFEDCNPRYGCYGDEVATTPNLDAFATEACTWTNAFSTAPVCSPARGAVITGMYPISVGIHHHRANSREQYPMMPYGYGAVLPHYVKCIPEYLRHAGYYCTNTSKTDYQFDAPPTAWDECSATAHWRNRSDPEQPFFAVFNLTRTHESQMWDIDASSAAPAITDPDDVAVPPFFPDTPRVRKAIARNYDNIAYNDARFGELLSQLNEDGLAQNTIVFHWSDHGPSVRGKRWPYEDGIHVPMMVRWPTSARAGGSPIMPASTSEDLVSTVDLGPTILELAGVSVPLHVQGRSFMDVPRLPGGPRIEEREPREYVYVSRDRYDEMYDMVRACRDQRFKYIRHFHPETGFHGWNSYRNGHPIMQELIKGYAEGSLSEEQMDLFRESRPPEELFDLQTDPNELVNLADDPAHDATLLRMRSALDAWRHEVGDMGELPEDVMYRMWYPDGKQPQTIAPRFVFLGADRFGADKTAPVPDAPMQAPVMMQLHPGTQGSSLEYRIRNPADDGDPPWRLYRAPVRLPSGELVLEARAARIGYAVSSVTAVSIVVKELG